MKAHMDSVDRQEISQFSKDAERWWDGNGPFAPLHRLNPARLGYIKKQICTRYGLDGQSLKPFGGLSVLDIGCGGGLVCEPMARMGAKVTGADADAVAIEVAQDHAAQSGLTIEYLNKAVEELMPSCPAPSSSSRRRPGSFFPGSEDPGLRRDDNEGDRDDNIGYDVVLALEIIEHVTSPDDFVASCASLIKPGGLVIFSTLNRTAKSFALGIVAAEYILEWVPRGTHHWKKFIRPSELAKSVRKAGLKSTDISGLRFNPLNGDFQISDTDIDVNYFLTAKTQD